MTLEMNQKAMSESILTYMRSKGGYATMKELKEVGIHTRKVKKSLEKGHILKIKAGLYKLRYYQRDEYESFVDIHTANDRAIVCLSSALAYHELTTFNPSKVTVSVPNNTDKFELEIPPIDVYYFRKNIYEAGIEEINRSYGNFKVYNKPKTVCDMFHFRNKLGEDLAFEGLKNYLNEPDTNLNEIQKYMKICRVKTVMKPYLKAMVSG
jgi:predicted transcriptional regulator of viral defense system